MFVVMLVTKSGATFRHSGPFATRQSASTYAASALRGTLSYRKSRIKGYQVVDAAALAADIAERDATWAGRS